MNSSTSHVNAPSGASLSLGGLTKSYGGTPVLKGIDLEVAQGEFITFLGPSGSGKTTTLNLIAGFLTADSGSILMDDQPLGGLPPHKRNIGMVFQNYALFPHMDVFANVAYPLVQRKIPRTDRKRLVQQALDRVELGGLGARYPRELSGGQQQRVAIARALVFNPRVVLMDEPLGALDKKLREALQLEIKKIHRELGLTFVYVTHDQEEALVLSDRIAVFDAGAIEQIGSAPDLYERPASGSVARFIGSSNCFPGRLTVRGSGKTVTSGRFEFAGACPTDMSDGDAASLVVRPERITIQPEGVQHDAGREVLTGLLEEIVYLGATQKHIVSLDSSDRAIASGAVRQDLRIGDRVSVSWAFTDALIVPEGRPPAPTPAVATADALEPRTRRLAGFHS